VRDATGTDGFNLNPPATGGSNATLTGAGSVTRLQVSLGLQLMSGSIMYWNAANNSTQVTFRVDSSGMGYWNGDASLTGFQWYKDNVLAATLSPTTFQLGRDTTLNIRNASDYGVTISSLASPGGVYYASNATYPHNFQIDGSNALSASSGTIDFWAQKSVRYWNAANSGYTELKFLADTSGGNQLQLASRGAVLHHNDPGYTGGGVVTSTSPAPATGTAGVIYFEVA
jgi:hypothetical protein